MACVLDCGVGDLFQGFRCLAKPKLGISQEAAALFTKHAIKLTHFAIGTIIDNKYQGPTPHEIITACEAVPEITTPINHIGLTETHNLITGILAVQIKKNHNTTGLRIEHEKDFLTCIELFSSAIDTKPDPQDMDQIGTKISWGTITCDIFNLDIANNTQAKIFINLARHFGLAAPNPIFELNLASEDLFRELNRLFPKEPMSEIYYKAGITYLILVGENDIAGCYGGLLFLLAFSLSRTSLFRSQSWGRRFTDIQRKLLMGNTLLNSLSEGSARELSVLLDSKIKDGLDPDLLTKEFNSIVSQSFSHVPQLIAVASQVDFKGLAPIQLIGRAISERTEIPWETLLEKFPILAEELNLVNQYITEIGSDVFAGIKYGGVAQELKNLLYLSVRALIVIGGEETLRNYAGFGGDNSQLTVPFKITLDAIIERLKDRQVKLASEIEIDTTDSGTSTKNQSNLRRVVKFVKFRKDSGNDEDDDDDNPPPGPSGAILSALPPYQSGYY